MILEFINNVRHSSVSIPIHTTPKSEFLPKNNQPLPKTNTEQILGVKRYAVREINNPSNIIMTGSEENCREYCDNNNELLKFMGESEYPALEVAPME